jgi:small GTP-binding protein
MGSCIVHTKPTTTIIKSSTNIPEGLDSSISTYYSDSRRKSLFLEPFEEKLTKTHTLRNKKRPSMLAADLQDTKGTTSYEPSKKTDLHEPPTVEPQSNENRNNCTIQIAVLGHKGVGKSTWVEKYIKNKFVALDVVSICVEEHVYEVKQEGKVYRLHFHILPGDEEYQEDYKHLLTSADFFLVFYDVTLKASFDKAVYILTYGINDYIKQTGFNKNVILVGNKCDLVNTAVANKVEIARDFCKKNSYENIETSAKSNTNLQLVAKLIILFSKVSKI